MRGVRGATRRVRMRARRAQRQRWVTPVGACTIGLTVVPLAACSGATLEDGAVVLEAGDLVVDPHGPVVDDPAAVLDAVAEAMRTTDLDRLVELSTDAAAVYFAHVRHVHAATADAAHLFENLTVELDPPMVDGATATAEGVIAHGSAEGAPPRVLTAWRLRETPDGWRVAGFTRNDEPVERWTAPGTTAAPVRHADIEVAVAALFVDVGCFTGSDAGCPAAVRDSFAVDLMVTNDTGHEIAPVPVELPDGEAVPAYVDTGIDAHPVVQADAPGFPSGVSAEVTAVFRGASQLVEGGTLHLAFETATGDVVPFEVPLPGYPHAW
jgi:hypothetical protein